MWRWGQGEALYSPLPFLTAHHKVLKIETSLRAASSTLQEVVMKKEFRKVPAQTQIFLDF